MLNTQVIDPTPAGLAQAAQVLQQGGLVAMPTETVYGLAGDALNSDALLQIFQAKNRPTFDPLIVHLAVPTGSKSWLDYLESEQQLVDLSDWSESLKVQIEALLKQLWPGPLTLVMPKTAQVPDLATSGLPTVALRVPRHPIAQALIRAAGRPLAAPSANRFGHISPTTSAAVLAELGGKIPLILEGGTCEVGLESTIVQVELNGSLQVLRPGGITLDQLQALTPLPVVYISNQPADAEHLPAPGLLKSHYAPTKPCSLLPGPIAELTRADLKNLALDQKDLLAPIGVLLFSGDPDLQLQRLDQLSPIDVQVLSRTGDLTEAAQTLFAKLRQLDQGPAQLLLIEPCPISTGLGYAISDRLQRATARSRVDLE